MGRYPLRRCRCPLPDVGYPALFISAPAPKVFSGCADCMPLGGTSVASLCALCAGRVRRVFRHWSLLCVVLECTCICDMFPVSSLLVPREKTATLSVEHIAYMFVRSWSRPLVVQFIHQLVDCFFLPRLASRLRVVLAHRSFDR